MESLIPIVNKLQDVFTSLGVNLQIDLPQIAVIGSQSSGKSSVLESLVGKDFLPRGNGIVTRRPLVLQLINASSEYGEFLHKRGTKFTQFDMIRAEIENETIRITGKNKGISDLPINLRIFSPNVLNLTLIDLPGLTKVAVGDQPSDIEVLIRDMILQYIKNDSCLILAVTPANTDIATSDSLKLASEVDPQGLRTIGVITKLDIMDAGTDARDVLDNRVVPLRKGYIGIINRSQKDIESNKSIPEALNAERHFFMVHPSYRTIYERLGTKYLQQVLSHDLTLHIKECLPNLKNHLQKQMLSLEKYVDQYKHFQPDDPTIKSKIMLQIIQQFQSEFHKSIEGSGSPDVNTIELSGGAKINRIFHERLHYEILNITQDESGLRNAISIAIQNTHGVRVGLFTPDMAFETIVKTQIATLKEPLLKCVSLVVEELSSNIRSLCEPMSSYPNLRQESINLLISHIRNQEQICKKQVLMLVDFELAYMNTNHDDFIGLNNENMNKAFKKFGNQVIRKGYMSVHFQNYMVAAKTFWFVLTSESLTWFKDGDEKQTKFILLLDGLKVKDGNSGFISKKHTLCLYFPDGRNVYKDQKVLELACDTHEELYNWKSSFLRTGIYSSDEMYESGIQTPKNPQLERQVETIRNLVDSYMKIVSKNVKDLAPKAVMMLIINSTKDFIDNELISKLCSREDQHKLMEESPEGAKKREEMLRLYHACKDALKTISDVSMAIGMSSMNTFNHSQDLVVTMEASQDSLKIQSCPATPKNSKPQLSTKIQSLFGSPNPKKPLENNPKSWKGGINKLFGRTKIRNFV